MDVISNFNISTVSDVPTSSAYCATQTYANLTGILYSCCNSTQVAFYHQTPDEPAPCFQYCNITDPSLTWQSVSKCIEDQAKEGNIAGVSTACGPSKDSKSGSSTHGVSTAVRLVFALVMAGISMAA